MKKYDFDKIIDRNNTLSLKYDFDQERGMPKDILPFWVADMDFRGPDELIEELKKCASHGIFGYSEVKDDYNKIVCNWFERNFDYALNTSWLIKTPGVVYAICTAIKAYTNIGDCVLIQNPVYYPFSMSISDNDRVVVNNPLIYENGKYYIDFLDFEQKIIDNNVKLFILCSPHNPVGRVYSKDELLKIGNICKKYNVIVVSDEIHCDFARKGFKHHLFPSIDKSFEEFSVLLTAPSKTFNIAGLHSSNIFIANNVLRDKFKKEIDKTGISQLNVMGLVGTRTVYEYGEEWLSQLKTYLEENLDLIKSFLHEKLPKIKLIEPEGTYLAWLDFSELNLNDEVINEIIINKANLWLDKGTIFGDEGKNFQRINYACSREFLQKGLSQLYSAFSDF